ncbi:MAG: LytTR family DNA-binding domain-containing protein [Bacteroidota bacterium]
MIRTVIIEDNPLQSKRLARLLNENFSAEIDVVGFSDRVDTARQLIADQRPDLAFMDIELLDGNAFELLETLEEINFQIVFVTAFSSSEFLVRAIRLQALDYLVKPAHLEDLQSLMPRLTGHDRRPARAQFAQLMTHLSAPPAPDPVITLVTQDQYIYCRPSQIIRCESAGGGPYIYVHRDDSQPLLITGTLKSYEELLTPYRFARCHRSHLIHLDKVTAYDRRNDEVIMKDGSRVMVAESNKKEILHALASR